MSDYLNGVVFSSVNGSRSNPPAILSSTFCPACTLHSVACTLHSVACTLHSVAYVLFLYPISSFLSFGDGFWSWISSVFALSFLSSVVLDISAGSGVLAAWDKTYPVYSFSSLFFYIFLHAILYFFDSLYVKYNSIIFEFCPLISSDLYCL